MYRCFVVCPFGHEDKPGEDQRLFRELKGLYDNVFARATAICRERNFKVEIVDGRGWDEGRHILSATQRAIDRADAVIVILTAHNPNVFVELGWAQGMWHDPILLMRDGYPLPVDINNVLCVPFTEAQADGRDAKSAEKTARLLADKLIERIRTRRQDKPFEHWPDTTLARGSVRLYNRFSRGIAISDWAEMIRSAEKEIIVASSGMSRIAKQRMFWRDAEGDEQNESFGQLLWLRALDGVKVTVLMYHEDNITIDQMKRHEDRQTVRKEVRDAYKTWLTLRLAFENVQRRAAEQVDQTDLAPGGSFRVVQLRKRHLPYRVTFTEKRVLITMRFYTEILNSGLCIDAPAVPQGPDEHNVPVHIQIRDELRYLIEQNAEASEERYQKWVSTGSI